MGELNQKPGDEGKHGLELRTALNLGTKVTHKNTKGPGQRGRKTATLPLILLLGSKQNGGSIPQCSVT